MMATPQPPSPSFKPWRAPTHFWSGLYCFSPEDCQEILNELNDQNRPMNLRHVDFLAKEMTAGRFQVNGEPIIFSTNGRLLDGQHRLAAALQTHHNMWCVLVVGVNASSFSTIDCGRTRRMSDVLSIEGESNTTTLASVLALIRFDLLGIIHLVGSGGFYNGKPSHAELAEILRLHPEARDSANFARAHKSKSLVTPKLLGYLHWRLTRIDPDAAASFLDAFLSGVDLAVDSPVYLLRSRLIDNLASKAKLPPREILALCFKAWNSWRDGVSLKYLRWRNSGPKAEDFPVPR